MALCPNNLLQARFRYRHFIDSCKDLHYSFSLTPRAESSAYALCFAIFGYHLLLATDVIDSYRGEWDHQLRADLTQKRIERSAVASLSHDKPYLQLLTFTLSALMILGTLTKDPLEKEIIDLLPNNIDKALLDSRSLTGAPRSGNQAMFLGILLIYSRDYLGLDVQHHIDSWIDLHLTAMNSFGFWGNSATMSHLQFQNAYHQYELFAYMNVPEVPWVNASEAVATLADIDGHFAPYPGGGGCYDYDAAFFLTSSDRAIARHRDLLIKLAYSILKEQNLDGGYCESHCVRPRSFANFSRSLVHVLKGRGQARTERLRYCLTLLRTKHDRIHTHWSVYSREWGESDLWDSWFRMLSIARIDCALNPEHATDWGFINFPGIGFNTILSLNISL